MQQLTKQAVTIVQVIKNNLTAEPNEVIKLILDAIPEISADELTKYLLTLDNEIGNKETHTIAEMIAFIQQEAIGSPSDIHWNSLWQNLAQGIVFIGHIIEGLVPPKWGVIIKAVLAAYEGLKS